MKFVLLSVICGLLGAGSAFAAEVVVESVTGTGTAEISRGGKRTIAQEGDPVAATDHVLTFDAVAVRLRYPNGSHITLSANADLEIGNPVAGAPSVALIKGNALAHIAKPASANPALRKFFLKTNTAVMGVRGTEFVVDVDPADNRMELHTLSGEVEVAKSQEDLLANKSERVGAGRSLRADRQGLGKAQKFDRAAFGKQRHERHGMAQKLGAGKLRGADELAHRKQERDAKRPADKGDRAERKGEHGRGGRDRNDGKATDEKGGHAGRERGHDDKRDQKADDKREKKAEQKSDAREHKKEGRERRRDK